jgi:peptidyl-prolyl cis-trans isomerase B (cyclophilin B)
VRLAGEGFYDGTTFHRVIPGFMIQGGDPLSRDRDPRNDGSGNADEQIADEFSKLSHVPGIVALANRGRAGSGSGQFFITIDEDRSLDGRYAIFGHLLEGLEIAEAIAEVERDLYGRSGPTNRPIEDVVIESVRIVPAATDTAAAETDVGSAPKTTTP